MIYLTYTISIIILFLLVLILLLRKEIKELNKDIIRMEKEKKEEIECVIQAGGLNEYNEKMRQIKEERKEKILEFLKEKGKTGSAEIADFLEVSRYSASRYLSELVEEGRVLQKGTIGRGVKYRLKD